MTSEELFLSFSFIATFTYICGWLVDRIMGYGGFGVIGNWLLLLLGIYIGLYGYNAAGYTLHWDTNITIAVAAGSGCCLLFLMATFKALIA